MSTPTREQRPRGGRDHRNPRPASIGTGGRLRSESPADFVGIRSPASPRGRRSAGGGVGERKHFHSISSDAGAPGGGGHWPNEPNAGKVTHSMMCSRHSGDATACRNEAILRFARLVLVPGSRSARARALGSLAQDTAHGGSRRPVLRWREASQTDGRSPRFRDSKVPPEQRLEAVCPGFLVQGSGTVGQPIKRIRLASRRRLTGDLRVSFFVNWSTLHQALCDLGCLIASPRRR
jgi:hypothetical protein